MGVFCVELARSLNLFASRVRYPWFFVTILEISED
jgi:hypothetical protein